MNSIIKEVIDVTELIVQDFLKNNPEHDNMFRSSEDNINRSLWLLNQKEIISKQDVGVRLEYRSALYEHLSKYLDNPLVFYSLQRFAEVMYDMSSDPGLLSFNYEFLKKLSVNTGEALSSENPVLVLKKIKESLHNMPLEIKKNIWHCLKTVEQITLLYRLDAVKSPDIDKRLIELTKQVGVFFESEAEICYSRSPFDSPDSFFKDTRDIITEAFQTKNYAYVDALLNCVFKSIVKNENKVLEFHLRDLQLAKRDNSHEMRAANLMNYIGYHSGFLQEKESEDYDYVPLTRKMKNEHLGLSENDIRKMLISGVCIKEYQWLMDDILQMQPDMPIEAVLIEFGTKRNSEDFLLMLKYFEKSRYADYIEYGKVAEVLGEEFFETCPKVKEFFQDHTDLDNVFNQNSACVTEMSF